MLAGNSNNNSKHSGHQQVEINSSHGANLTSKSSSGGGKGHSNSSSPSPRSSSNAHGSSRNSSSLGTLQAQQGRNSHNLMPQQQQQQQQQHRGGLYPCRFGYEFIRFNCSFIIY